jgi:tyrosyl-tRNA synthetase
MKLPSNLLSRNIEEVIVKKHLEKILLARKKLRIKLGADPTAPDLHLGHSVVLRKLKEFQDLGHKIVFIIGDFTAKIGDPTGRLKTRPTLSDAEIKKNAETYFRQVGKILDIEKTEIRYNSEWFVKEGWSDVLKLVSKFTVARILERDDFARRLREGIDIGVHEILYPIMQAYDSIQVRADVEIGGTDQKFNMLAGRDLQRKLKFPEQDVITVPLLVGLDGKEKMSKSKGNYIALFDSPNEMFGKIMSIPDNLIIQYFRLLTNVEAFEIKQMEDQLEDSLINPRDLKAKLAYEVVILYYGRNEALIAEKEFEKIFRKKGKPTKIPEIKIRGKKLKLIDLLSKVKLVTSKSEARRLISQGGVKIDDKIIKEWNREIMIKSGIIIQAGKRRFIKIK